MKWRIPVIIFIFGIFYSLLILNIYNLQFNKRGYYLRVAASQNSAGGVFNASRGNIYFTDKNGNPIQVALNKDYPIIYAVPSEIQKSAGEPRVYAEKLSPILNIPAGDIEKQLSKKNDQYELLIAKASSEQTEAVKKLNIKGIYIKDKTLRFYPFGTLGAHILGFASSANQNETVKPGDGDIGRYGLELYFDDKLAGVSGELSGDKFYEPEKGEDLFLTIDRNIQAQAEESLKNLVEGYNAEKGSVIVAEPKTGKILAMASFPNFDPNNYSEFSIAKFLNPAVQAVYEPGSIFKIITMSAGIDSGKIMPNTAYNDTGYFTANKRTISNWDIKTHGSYGKATMTNVIEHSINTGAVFAERQTGNDIFYDYLVKFGLNELTGIKLPGEVRGNLNNLKKGKEIDFATASYGQGVSVTPIELVSAVSAIANGGVLMKPYILNDDKPEVLRRVISEETSKKVIDMMVSAVVVNKVASIPDYNIAGKTGTAFIPIFGGKGYSEDVINTYVGFAPAYDPKFIILLKLDRPAGAPVAALTVVPSFRELTRYILNYYNIAPDKL
ncbi:penicillin-binding protein 2 [Candidatus Wolfebacteria bacterium]|nr:penicillin-binding protein 2 [Candidatus Wolfebacteria bacterium]